MTETAALVTLIVGVVVGFIGQRSGYCSATGYRDLYLIHDTYLFNGVLGTFVGALVGYVLADRVIGAMPGFPFLLNSPGLGSGLVTMLTVMGGLGIGFFSILAKGCPFRQHVMAAEGRKTAMAYLAGFYVGILYFFTILIRVITMLSKFV